MRKLHVYILGALIVPLIQGAAFAQCAGENLSDAVAGTSILNTLNTAFTTQTSAFTGGPTGTLPDQPGGGFWARGVGGHVDDSATGTFNQATVGTFQCNASFLTNYEGGQLGVDVARFHLNGGQTNVYLGVTGGYLAGNGHDNTGAFSASFSVPFAGVYAAMTNGGFFSDVLYRHDFVDGTLTLAPLGWNNQRFIGNADSVTLSAGYQIPVGQSSFIEPSAALILAELRIDPTNVPGAAGGAAPGTVNFGTIDSDLGRAGVRVGTNVGQGNFVWTPFVAANVWNEFAGASNSAYTCSCTTPFTLSTSRVGTFGQYVAGISTAVPNSGWLGYARVDYRDGADIQAWGVNVGLRYQFSSGGPGPIVTK